MKTEIIKAENISKKSEIKQTKLYIDYIFKQIENLKEEAENYYSEYLDVDTKEKQQYFINLAKNVEKDIDLYFKTLKEEQEKLDNLYEN